jgi:hypothetical protein
MLCANGSPSNHEVFLDARFKVRAFLGPNCEPNDGVRHWVNEVKTEDPKTLWDPTIGIRRQAGWDDHGEAYPTYKDGPDLWVAVEVPAGVYRLSLYFLNLSGHVDVNRMRDHVVEVHPFYKDLKAADARRTVLARTRVRDFCGGVYKQFLVNGPGKYHVRIARNNSLNTMVSAVLIDRLAGAPGEAESQPLAWMVGLRYEPPDPNNAMGQGPQASTSSDAAITAPRHPSCRPPPIRPGSSGPPWTPPTAVAEVPRFSAP